MSGFSVSKGIPYTKKPTVGMYITGMNMGRYGLWRIEDVTENGYSCGSCLAHFRTYDEAKAAVCEGNDWQNLGAKGHEVYKGNAIFNKAFKVAPWEHIYLCKDKIIFFVWDTREVVKVAKRPQVDIMSYLRIEPSDNKRPIAKDGKWLHQSELEALPVTFRTDKQIKEEAATEDDMTVNSDNTGLAPDVSVNSGDLFQDAIVVKLLKFTDGKNNYVFDLVSSTLYDSNMQIVCCDDLQACIRQYKLKRRYGR